LDGPLCKPSIRWESTVVDGFLTDLHVDLARRSIIRFQELGLLISLKVICQVKKV